MALSFSFSLPAFTNSVQEFKLHDHLPGSWDSLLDHDPQLENYWTGEKSDKFHAAWSHAAEPQGTGGRFTVLWFSGSRSPQFKSHYFNHEHRTHSLSPLLHNIGTITLAYFIVLLSGKLRSCI